MEEGIEEASQKLFELGVLIWWRFISRRVPMGRRAQVKN